ncbi:hypothetical protein B0J11DRAFT_172204 [Dendryphion nanum]|uniref:Uncharacterized protein n=1 Tax=Dendryphion nanum TaxID=256645 RepID=A0A9P9IYP9_9PLEO|nr:hypothetical protein B0J11DRAFT_172204 [Dendryphion nanum]
MLLDMLTTADAAAQHGHEYSPPRPSNPTPASSSYNGSFLLTQVQLPLSILTSVMRKQSPAPLDDDTPVSTTSPSPTRPHLATTTNLTSAIPTTTTTTNTPSRPHPMVPSSLVNSPAPSRPASSGSDATASTGARPKRRSFKSKTTYNLAQPPPTTAPRSALHFRPRILLQLHQVIPSRRPKPVYEVIPFSHHAPRSARRLARTFHFKDKLGPNDLLIVKAREYEQKDDDEKLDDDRWGTRDVIGIICPAKKADKDAFDKTQVLMDDGSSWDVTYMPNGGYEFEYTDHHGLHLQSRWIPKPLHSRRSSGMSTSSLAHASSSLGLDDKKFTFSTISPTSRRHPIIATMTRTSIDVLDFYNMPAATNPSTPLSPSAYILPSATPLPDAATFMETPNENGTVKTDDSLRRFITVSGIWVALCENWSPAYSSSKHVNCSINLVTSGIRPCVPSRAVSMSFLDSPRSLSPASTSEDHHRPVHKLFRSGTTRSHRSLNMATSSQAPASPKSSPSSSPRIKNRSRRSNSTGNVDIRPRNGSIRKRFGVAFEDQALPETEEERQSKRSGELLRIRELTLPDTPPATTTPTPTTPNPVLTTINIAQPPTDSRASSPDLRSRKTQSAYEPVTTAGLWDSGVIDGPGQKKRPTSMFVVNRKKEKAEKKKDWSKSKERKKDKELEKERKKQAKQLQKEQQKEDTQKPARLKHRILAIFRRERS